MIPEPEQRLNKGRLSEAPDEELVRLAVEGSGTEPGRAAASALLRRHQERIYLWCFRYVHDHEQALDLAQEVLLQVYRRLATFRSESRFSSWLFAVVRNRCLSAVRRPQVLVEEGMELDQVRDTRRLPDQQFQEERDEEALLRLIRTVLEPQEQEALWMRCVERLPVDEITRLLGIEATSGARAVLQAARRKLRAALAARGKRGES